MERENLIAIHWQTYLSIEKEVLELANSIYITDTPYSVEDEKITPLDTYSNHISDLLVRCAVEIESLVKFLYEYLYSLLSEGEQKNWPSPDNRKVNFDDKPFQLIDKIFSIKTKVVYINNFFFDLRDENRKIIPFSDEDFTSDQGWQKAYQGVKHDRYMCLEKGNVKNLLHACAALYLLNIYSRDLDINIGMNTPLQDYYDFGSSIFAVSKPPISEYIRLVVTNFPAIDESTPLVIYYSKKNYDEVQKVYQKCNSDVNKWISSQPELRDKDFIFKCKHHLSKNITIIDVISYRENKLIEIPIFEDKKDKLIHSDDWNYLKYHDLLNISDSDLTPLNIDDQIVEIETKYAEARTDDLYYRPLQEKIRQIPLTICAYGILPSSSYYKFSETDLPIGPVGIEVSILDKF